MDPFNIVIKAQGEQIDLNIHPQDGVNFKVVYHGGLVGEMFLDNGNWQAENSGHADILLDEAVIAKIGRELDLVLGRASG
nr:hypothetical protein [Pedobacter sp. ASV19]